MAPSQAEGSAMVGSLLHLLIYIAVIGLIVWALVTYVPMPPPFKAIIVVIAAIVALVLLLKAVDSGGLLSRHGPCFTPASISLPEYHCHGQSTA